MDFPPRLSSDYSHFEGILESHSFNVIHFLESIQCKKNHLQKEENWEVLGSNPNFCNVIRE